MVTIYISVLLFLQTIRFGSVVSKFGDNTEANADVVVTGGMIIFSFATLLKHLGVW